ncbi:MAG TPA: YbaK/EbsC family protein [Mycobacteriales bacterium]|nr:YbaK/EbsC family protein [Mycobacteriales bacterium]
MKDALDVHRALLAREVPHEVIRLPRLILSADEIPDALDLPAERCVAVRIYHADDTTAAVVVQAGETPHPGAVLAALGARTLRLARPDEVNRLTDFAAPLVSPVLLPDSVRVLADACVGHVDVVYAPTGDSGTVLGISSRWLLTASRASVAELCLPDAATADLASDMEVDVRQLAQRLRDWR